MKTLAMTTIRGWGPLPDLVRTMASNRTIWAHESCSRMFLSEREDHVVWTYTTGFETAETARQFSDHLLKPMLDFVRAFLGGTWMPDWLKIGYAAPQQQKDGEALLDVPIHYEQPDFGLPLQRADLCKPMQIAQSLPRARFRLLIYSNTRRGATVTASGLFSKPSTFVLWMA